MDVGEGDYSIQGVVVAYEYVASVVLLGDFDELLGGVILVCPCKIGFHDGADGGVCRVAVAWQGWF